MSSDHGAGNKSPGYESAAGDVGSDGSPMEEQPAMRAVALMSTAPSLVLEGRIGGGPSFGKAPPVRLAPLSPGKFSRPPMGSKVPRENSFTVRKEWSGVAPASVWNVKGEDLELVPLDFPLERTHREIPDTDASVVAARISDTLRLLSIEAEYDCTKGKAKCKTGDCVSFRIRLYAGDERGEPVVVEVQRRCGSASSFMRSCRAILDAAEGKNLADTVAAAPGRKGPPFAKPVGEMKCLRLIVEKESPKLEADAASALDGVVEMLKSKKADANILGLENLVALTDPLKTAPVVALSVSKRVALGDDVYDIRVEIGVLTERDVYPVGIEQEEEAVKHKDHLRHLALNVFANSLLMCNKDGCLAVAVSEQKWFADSLIPVLVDELKRAESSACNAHQAACCLHSLMSCSEQARRAFASHGGVEVLKDAKEFGEVRHALLAEETDRCLNALGAMSTTA